MSLGHTRAPELVFDLIVAPTPRAQSCIIAPFVLPTTFSVPAIIIQILPFHAWLVAIHTVSHGPTYPLYPPFMTQLSHAPFGCMAGCLLQKTQCPSAIRRSPSLWHFACLPILTVSCSGRMGSLQHTQSIIQSRHVCAYKGLKKSRGNWVGRGYFTPQFGHPLVSNSLSLAWASSVCSSSNCAL